MNKNLSIYRTSAAPTTNWELCLSGNLIVSIITQHSHSKPKGHLRSCITVWVE